MEAVSCGDKPASMQFCSGTPAANVVCADFCGTATDGNALSGVALGSVAKFEVLHVECRVVHHCLNNKLIT